MYGPLCKKLQYLNMSIWYFRASIKSGSSAQSKKINKQIKSNYTAGISKLNTSQMYTNIQQVHQNITPKVKIQPQIVKEKHAVVAIMGHVNHGKTTLIDYLRKSNIAEHEDGGITQKIGAFGINCHGKRITFIDTPGHETFTNIRQRGASVADLIILVVSAAEGVEKQTMQVIELIKKTSIPVIVALNKIDLPTACPLQVQASLQKAGLSLLVNGGQIPIIHISAKTGLNIDLLCELIAEQTKNKTAIFNGLARGSILEANKLKNNFNSMTVIVQQGTFKIGCCVVIKGQSFKIKKMLDDRGKQLQQAYPGEAVQILGVTFSPYPGDQIIQVKNMQQAKQLAEKNKRVQKDKDAERKKPEMMGVGIFKFERSREGAKQKRAFRWGDQDMWQKKFDETQQNFEKQIEQLEGKLQKGKSCQLQISQMKDKLQKHRLFGKQFVLHKIIREDEFPFIIKFGCRGMEETVLMQLEKLRNSIEGQLKIKLILLKTGIGDVIASDIKQANMSNSSIFAFGSRVTLNMPKFFNKQDYRQPRVHTLIHDLMSDIRNQAIKKKISYIKGVEKARSNILDIFKVKINRQQQVVPGIKVIQGKINKKYKAYIFKNGAPISNGFSISSVKVFKKQVAELKEGEEGTICFQQPNEIIAKGLQIIFYDESN